MGHVVDMVVGQQRVPVVGQQHKVVAGLLSMAAVVHDWCRVVDMVVMHYALAHAARY